MNAEKCVIFPVQFVCMRIEHSYFCCCCCQSSLSVARLANRSVFMCMHVPKDLLNHHTLRCCTSVPTFESDFFFYIIVDVSCNITNNKYNASRCHSNGQWNRIRRSRCWWERKGKKKANQRHAKYVFTVDRAKMKSSLCYVMWYFLDSSGSSSSKQFTPSIKRNKCDSKRVFFICAMCCVLHTTHVS